MQAMPVSSQNPTTPHLGFLFCSGLSQPHITAAVLHLTLESSSMIFCCSITWSLRKSTSLSSWLWSRSFKELGLLIVPALCLYKKPTWQKRKWSEGFAKGQYTSLPFTASDPSNLMAVLAAVLLCFCWALHLECKHAGCSCSSDCCVKLMVTREDSGHGGPSHQRWGLAAAQLHLLFSSAKNCVAFSCRRRNSESWKQCHFSLGCSHSFWSAAVPELQDPWGWPWPCYTHAMLQLLATCYCPLTRLNWIKKGKSR